VNRDHAEGEAMTAGELTPPQALRDHSDYVATPLDHLGYCPKCGSGRWFIRPADYALAALRGATMVVGSEIQTMPKCLHGICS
jgi:hypothetical protein